MCAKRRKLKKWPHRWQWAHTVLPSFALYYRIQSLLCFYRDFVFVSLSFALSIRSLTQNLMSRYICYCASKCLYWVLFYLCSHPKHVFGFFCFIFDATLRPERLSSTFSIPHSFYSFRLGPLYGHYTFKLSTCVTYSR